MVDKNKLKALEKAKAELAEKYKKPIIITGADIHMERLPFGIMSVDRLWGGGMVRGRWNMMYGSKSCIDGSAFIPYEVRTKDGKTQNGKGGTLQHLFERFHGIEKKSKGYYQRKQTISSEYFTTSINEDDRLIKNKILDVINQGEREVYEIITENGFKLKATYDHEFCVGDGKYKELRDLKVGDLIFVFKGDHRKKNCLYKIASPIIIKSIKIRGKTIVYDIKMESPHNNFLANNFVVHNCGKTSLCCKAIGNTQRDGGIAAYIDAEHAYDQDYAATFGVNNDELIYNRPETLEEGMTTLIKMAPIVDLVIIDSIVAIAPEAEMKREMEQETMALIARKLSQFFRDTTSIVGKSRAAILLVNQTRTDLGAYVPVDRYPGGNALAHACSFVMHMRRGSPKEDPMGIEIIDGKEKEVSIGKRLYIKAEKTKISANEGHTAYVDLLYKAPHFDEVTDILNIAQIDGIITRAGAFYYFGENKYQGEQNLIDALRKDSSMFKTLKDQIINPTQIQKEDVENTGDKNDKHTKTKTTKKKV